MKIDPNTLENYSKRIKRLDDRTFYNDTWNNLAAKSRVSNQQFHNSYYRFMHDRIFKVGLECASIGKRIYSLEKTGIYIRYNKMTQKTTISMKRVNDNSILKYL